jgi:chromosome segregation ATPase
VLNPLVLPAELLEQLRALSEAVRCLPAIERMVDKRLERMQSRLESLPADIESSLRGHFERQQAGVELMQEELVSNRQAAEALPPRVDRLLESIDAMRGELSANREAAEGLPVRLDELRAELAAVREEISQIRGTIEPLQGPAERLARVDERLPGGG